MRQTQKSCACAQRRTEQRGSTPTQLARYTNRWTQVYTLEGTSVIPRSANGDRGANATGLGALSEVRMLPLRSTQRGPQLSGMNVKSKGRRGSPILVWVYVVEPSQALLQAPITPYFAATSVGVKRTARSRHILPRELHKNGLRKHRCHWDEAATSLQDL